MARPVKIFISYARDDQSYLVGFRQHLQPLVDHGLIESFDDRQLMLGDEWDLVLRAKLDEAELVVFLVSAAFTNSRYIKEVELAEAMRRAKADARRCWLLPILVRPVALEYTPLGAFKAYPSRGAEGLKAVSLWSDQDEAWTGIVKDVGVWAKKQGSAEAVTPALALALAEAPPKPFVAAPPAKRTWAPGEVFRDIDAPWCPAMIVIPPGTFTMGSSPEEQQQAVADGAEEAWVKPEGPQRRVVIARPFALGKFAVTFAEFDEFVVDAGHGHQPEAPWGRGRMPVVNVSWRDAKAYCEWLSGKTKADYRLPSEAEWEYACRAGTETAFSFGPTISTDQANYDGNRTYANGKKGADRQRTVLVEEFRSNAFGLHQMHGNVWEWCEDPWHDSYVGAPRDGSVWTDKGRLSRRVQRGGSWDISPGGLRSAGRRMQAPSSRYDYTGIRLARMVTP